MIYIILSRFLQHSTNVLIILFRPFQINNILKNKSSVFDRRRDSLRRSKPPRYRPIHVSDVEEQTSGIPLHRSWYVITYKTRDLMNCS